MLDRRHFLIGAGALLTASFVKQAKAFSRRSGEPLVLPPARKPEETLYVYRQESDYGGEWRVSLGPDQPFAPPPPTWREHLRRSDIASKPMTRSSALAVSMICLWRNSTSA